MEVEVSEFARLAISVGERLHVARSIVEAAAWCVVVARHRGADCVVLELVGEVAPLNPGIVRIDLSDEPTFATLVRRLSSLVECAVTERVDAVLCRGATACTGSDIAMRLHVSDLIEAVAPRHLDDPGLGAVLVAQCEQVLRSASADSGRSVVAMNIVPPSQAAVIERWNDASGNYPLDRSYVALLREQAAVTPHHTAIATAHESLSYADLLNRTDRAGERLRQAGVGRDDFVGFLVDRGVDAALAMTATLAANGAFIALDTRNPASRLAHVLACSRPVAVIVAARYRGLLNDALALCDVAPEVIDVERLTEAISSSALTGAGPTDLVYGVTTSGTTGAPKVAMVEQQGFLNHGFAMIEALDLGPRDVVAQTAPLSFDIALWQYLVPLLTGATVAVVPDDVAANPAKLVPYMERAGVTVLQIVPSLLRALLDVVTDGSTKLGDGLRWIIPTGEALPVALARDWLALFPHRPLLNAYGPAECSDDTTFHVVDQLPPPGVTTVPIGRPIRNTSVLVLDEQLDPVAIGVVGEICLGGVAVGRGYCNDAERTAAAYVTVKCATPQRVYRTGDLGRFRSDGVLEYVGRRDFQLKIRGHRIEAGEVEAAIDAHAGVRESVVVGHGDAEARQLVAYVVAYDSLPSSEVLRAHLSQRLPSYMIPSVFIPLHRLPLTGNGKVDRRSLPVPTRPGDALARDLRDSAGATTATEQRLVGLWREVLRTDHVDLDDNFFDIGGTSIMAAVLFWKMARDLDVDLPLSTLMIAPTVRKLAERIDRRAEMSPPVLVPLQPNGDKAPLFLFHAQGGETLGYRYLAEHLDPTRPVYGLDPTRVRGRTPPPASMDAMVDRYLAVIREQQPNGPYVLGGYCMGGAVAWVTAQRLQAEGADVRLVVLLQSDHPDYPVLLRGLSARRARRAKLQQRAAFELRALRLAGAGRRGDYLRVNGLGKIWAAATLPVERRLDAWALARGRSYAGSERLDIDRWRRSDGGVFHGYDFAPYNGTVLQIRAEHQPTYAVRDPTLGWGPLLAGPHHVDVVPGHHLDFLSRQATSIAAIINRHLRHLDP